MTLKHSGVKASVDAAIEALRRSRRSVEHRGKQRQAAMDAQALNPSGVKAGVDATIEAPKALKVEADGAAHRLQDAVRSGVSAAL
jgi:hypothetical protein